MLGTVIADRYRLTQIVGKGGMGIVYRAEDVRLSGRPCAIKLLLGTSMDPEEAKRFEREVRIISRLRSQNVVQVLDTGSLLDGRRYIVMELLEGLPLSTMLKRGGPVSQDRAVTLIRGVLAGLAEAHEHGVVHRDLKPANVVVCHTRTGDEVAKVLDFGIAKETGTGSGDTEDLTGASMLIGTPKYMAPEQFLKQPADGRTDLYASGLLFYQMLTGAPPFTEKQGVPDSVAKMPPEFRIGWLHINEPAQPLQLADGLWGVLERLLAKEPEHRYQSAEHALAALQPYVARQTIMPGQLMVADLPSGQEAAPPSGPISGTTGFPVVGETLTQKGPPKDKRRVWPLAVALMIIAGGAGAWLALQDQAKPDDDRHALGVGICVDEIRSAPSGAVVKMGGRSLGVTPYETQRPCGEVWMIEVEAKGYQTRRIPLRSRSPRGSTFVPLGKEAAKPAPRTAPVPAPKPKVDGKVRPKRRPKAGRRPSLRRPPKPRVRPKPKKAIKPPPPPAPKPKPKPDDSSPLPF